MMSKRELPPIPAIMDESQYSVENTGSPPQNEPLAMALLDINEKLLGLGKLYRKLEKSLRTFMES